MSSSAAAPRGVVHCADGVAVARTLEDESVDLVYLDPPFNTGRRQTREQLRTRRVEDGEGDRSGFGGRRYETERLGSRSFEDAYDDYLGFLEPFLVEAQRALAPTGSLYLHLDYREVHYAKVLADEVFGRDNFVNEIIWAYDYGARPKRRWPAKHDNILFYAKDAARNVFNADDIERIPYMAPGLVGPEKAARGKLPTDTWWHTIVSPTGREKLGYPTQKPLGVLERIVRASSPPGGLVVDFVAGSGTTGEAALRHGRRFVLADHSREAAAVMKGRFDNDPRVRFIGFEGIEPADRPSSRRSGRQGSLL
jgi:site-specific DNA-methyltransferase (adenine-specific)